MHKQMNKSLILKKAIDYIKYLQALTKRLKQQIDGGVVSAGALHSSILLFRDKSLKPQLSKNNKLSNKFIFFFFFFQSNTQKLIKFFD